MTALLAGCASDSVAGPTTAPGGTVTTPKTTGAAPSTTGPPTTEAPPTTTPMAVSDVPVAVHEIVPHRAIFRGGKLYLEGDVPSKAVAQKIIAKAVAVVGKANVVNHYRIDPAAPAITGGRVIIDESLLFDTGSATLNPAAKTLIPLGIAVMKLNPRVVMRVTGHTDDVGDARTNIVLATARALAVVDAIAPAGVARSRFVVVGKGESDPVASNATEEGRRMNRRIEVDLLHLLA